MMLQTFSAAQRQGTSEREFSSEHDVPRTTLQYWQKRRDQIEAAPRVVAFFESPEGVVFLERLVLAAHVVMTQMGTCGIRLVSTFLEYAGLEGFIGCSFGAQQQVSSEVLDLVITYGKEEQARLKAIMPHKRVTLCLDETFPSQGQCLVAMEPVSGFVLLEEYREKRDAVTWNRAIEQATKGMNIEVEQVTSDGAKALIRHAKDQNAHYSPDLFHVQQDITRAMGQVMGQHLRRAEQAVVDSAATLDEHKAARQAYEHGLRKRGRPPHFDKRIEGACDRVQSDRAALKAATDQKGRYTAALRGVGDQYHPYSLETGAPRNAELLAEQLGAQFAELDELATDVCLSDKRCAKLAKARRVAPRMVATLSFYHQQVEARLQAETLSTDERSLLMETWIPAAYLMIAAPKARDSESGEALRQLSTELMAAQKPAWESLSLDAQKRLDGIARSCAQVFQRSSSCVEGRNGVLALAEHARRQLPEKKLRSLTVFHNYAIRRTDGTTAAERFFGTPPHDLFDWLLTRFSRVPRPRKRRSQAEKEIPLLCQ